MEVETLEETISLHLHFLPWPAPPWGLQCFWHDHVEAFLSLPGLPKNNQSWLLVNRPFSRTASTSSFSSLIFLLCLSVIICKAFNPEMSFTILPTCTKCCLFTISFEPFVWIVRFLIDPGCAKCQGSDAKTFFNEKSKTFLDAFQDETTKAIFFTFTSLNSVANWFLTEKTSSPSITIFNQNSPRKSSWIRTCHF